jgi:hypothetical protein
MKIDLSSDWQYVDFLEDATLKVAGFDDVPLSNCVLTEPQTWRELDPSYGQIVREGMLFVWPHDLTQKPPLGSVLVDAAGEYWTILRLLYKQHVETWEASCINLSIMANLDNFATILRANSYTKNASGEAVPVWTAITSDIPARWQPLSEETTIHEDADFSKTTYRVTFGAQPIAEPKQLSGGDYRLVDKDGNWYRCMEYILEERLDQLPVCIAVKVYEGSEWYQHGGSGV